MERERARRAFARAEDVGAEIEKFRADVVDRHVRALADRIASGPMQREATRLYILRTADELAGEDASSVLRQVALSVVLFDLESHLASCRLLEHAATGPPALALVRWRASAELRLNAKLKSLAYVRDLEESKLTSSLARLRVKAG